MLSADAVFSCRKSIVTFSIYGQFHSLLSDMIGEQIVEVRDASRAEQVEAVILCRVAFGAG